MSKFMNKLSLIIILVLLVPVAIPAHVMASGRPNITVIPKSIDFGPVSVGASSAEAVVTIINESNDDLGIYGIKLAGSDASNFAITGDNASNSVVPPWESATVSVRFKPLIPGSKTAYLRITYGDEICKYYYCVYLGGQGVLPSETDLSISKSASPDPVYAGEDITYTVSVTNGGYNTASNVYALDRYPTSALTIKSVTPSQGTITSLLPQWVIDILAQELGIPALPPDYSYIIWNVGELAGGASADLTIVATVDPDIQLPEQSPIYNQAYVASSSEEPDWDNNMSETATDVEETTPPTTEPTTTPPTTEPTTTPPTTEPTTTPPTTEPTTTPPTTEPTTTPPTTEPTTTTPGGKPPTTSPTTTTPSEHVATSYFTVDFLGEITRVEASADGRPLEDVVAYSPDNAHVLVIEAGTRASDSQGNAVTYIKIRQAEAPQLPVNTVLAGEAFDITPSGTAFDHPFTLSLGYLVEDLPADFISIGMAYHDLELGWKHLDSIRNHVAGGGSLTSAVNHLTVFAILVEVPAIVSPPDETDTQLPASFVLSNLSITASETKTWKGLTFIARYGEDAAITVDVTNAGGQAGSYQVFLLLNGARVDMATVNLEPGETKQLAFNVTGNEPGIYTVQVGELSGDFESSLWINGWLIAGFIAALLLLVWLLVFLIRRRRQQVESQ